MFSLGASFESVFGCLGLSEYLFMGLALILDFLGIGFDFESLVLI